MNFPPIYAFLSKQLGLNPPRLNKMCFTPTNGFISLYRSIIFPNGNHYKLLICSSDPCRLKSKTQTVSDPRKIPAKALQASNPGSSSKLSLFKWQRGLNGANLPARPLSTDAFQDLIPDCSKPTPPLPVCPGITCIHKDFTVLPFSRAEPVKRFLVLSANSGWTANKLRQCEISSGHQLQPQ